MKGNAKLIDKLNELLAEELTAIMQYVVHAEMDANWGYARLHEAVEKRSMQEMRHAEKLIARILFLEGTPVVTRLNQVNIGKDVPKQIDSDLASEMDAVKHYNEAIRLASEAGDAATRDQLESILADEDKHVDWLEEQLDQIAQMGVENYLSTQNRA